MFDYFFPFKRDSALRIVGTCIVTKLNKPIIILLNMHICIPFSIWHLYRLILNAQIFTCKTVSGLIVSVFLSSKLFCIYKNDPLSSLQWFCENAALDTNNSLEKQKVFKFRGDLAVRQGDYQVSYSVYHIFPCMLITRHS